MTVLCSVTANHLGLVRVQAEALADHPLAAGDEAAARAVLGLVRGLGRAQHHLRVLLCGSCRHSRGQGSSPPVFFRATAGPCDDVLRGGALLAGPPTSTSSVARRPVLPPDDLARPALDDACAGGEVWQVGGAGDVEVEGAELLALPAHRLQLLQHRAHARVQAEVSTWRSVTLQRVAMVMVGASMEVPTVSQAYTLVSPESPRG